MKICLLPDELIDNIFSFIENIYIENKKKFVRKFVFLRYKHNFDLYFNRTNLEFYKYALKNNSELF